MLAQQYVKQQNATDTTMSSWSRNCCQMRKQSAYLILFIIELRQMDISKSEFSDIVKIGQHVNNCNKVIFIRGTSKTITNQRRYSTKINTLVTEKCLYPPGCNWQHLILNVSIDTVFFGLDGLWCIYWTPSHWFSEISVRETGSNRIKLYQCRWWIAGSIYFSVTMSKI